jgi:5-deoxy-glucuronate isomerase
VTADGESGSGGLYHPAGSLAADGWELLLTPEVAGWTYSGLRVAALGPGGRIRFETGRFEAIVLSLSGSARITSGGETIELAGRESVFAGPSDFVYLPRGASAAIDTDGGGRFAVAMALAEHRLPRRYVPARAIPIEERGGGAALRYVRNFGAADVFEADRLIAVEVITPGGNWSSWPPHKHDEERPGETVLEESYLFGIAPGPGGPGMGYQRVYGTPERPLDTLVEVRDGDLVLVPHGWHGPAMAAPGYDMYYLNVMAGPERAWQVSFDPTHAWVRDTW